MTRPRRSPVRASVGLEWEEDAPDLDTVLVAVGGGGLIAGIAAWYGRRVKVVGVEPEGSRACMLRSKRAGPVDVTVESVAADSLGARNTGQLVYDIARAERRSRRAGAGRCDRRRRSACCGIACASPPSRAARPRSRALISGRYKPRADEKVGVLLCGANVDLAKLGEPNRFQRDHAEVMRILGTACQRKRFLPEVGAVVRDLMKERKEPDMKRLMLATVAGAALLAGARRGLRSAIYDDGYYYGHRGPMVERA